MKYSPIYAKHNCSSRTMTTIIIHETLLSTAQPWRICYFTNWAQYRPEPGHFVPGDIDPSLCTHIYYAFSDMDGNALVEYEVNDLELLVFHICMYMYNVPAHEMRTS